MISENPDEVFSALAPHRYLQFIPCLDSFDGIKKDTSLSVLQYGRFLERIYKKYAARLRAGKWISIRSFDNWIGMLGGYPPENCRFLGRCGRAYLVESNGNIYPCDFYALDEWLLGNIHDHSFYKLALHLYTLNFSCDPGLLTRIVKSVHIFRFAAEGAAGTESRFWEMLVRTSYVRDERLVSPSRIKVALALKVNDEMIGRRIYNGQKYLPL